MTDGIITLDTDRGRLLGFTSDRFGGYLWKKGDRIYVSMIISAAKGNFRQLVQTIRERGLSVAIPTPLGRMEEIVRKNGYRQEFPYDEQYGECVEVWVLDPVQSEEKPTHQSVGA